MPVFNRAKSRGQNGENKQHSELKKETPNQNRSIKLFTVYNCDNRFSLSHSRSILWDGLVLRKAPLKGVPLTIFIFVFLTK